MDALARLGLGRGRLGVAAKEALFGADGHIFVAESEQGVGLELELMLWDAHRRSHFRRLFFVDLQCQLSLKMRRCALLW